MVEVSHVSHGQSSNNVYLGRLKEALKNTSSWDIDHRRQALTKHNARHPLEDPLP